MLFPTHYWWVWNLTYLITISTPAQVVETILGLRNSTLTYSEVESDGKNSQVLWTGVADVEIVVEGNCELLALSLVAEWFHVGQCGQNMPQPWHIIKQIMSLLHRLCPWRHQACWHRNVFNPRASRGVCEQPMGHCVWWFLESFWCKGCLQTAWLLWLQ